MESNQSNSDLVMRDYNCAALKNDLLMNGNPRLSESSEGSIGPWQWRAAAQISFGSGQSNPSGRYIRAIKNRDAFYGLCVEKISSPAWSPIRVLQRALVVGNASWIAVHRDDH
ncbi:Crossover junction endonuclease mus81 [Puccinia graminis f. sp. tritici]|uniref:Crossover junction endonuclease mus81 n=1 Tax=Puccinia graminis f. sp. tritici TaxID=56615 RepID=A0A5B0RD08_PUCGR|nr:Crossover junction endonuclease mus81 [Puccinia graminis f. sp. tritici]